ncbi:MAG: WD40 domain-containing protein [Gemmataceae bacterium]|nr:WD40 domain-containing protein [Gemmataceae bacterium]
MSDRPTAARNSTLGATATPSELTPTTLTPRRNRANPQPKKSGRPPQPIAPVGSGDPAAGTAGLTLGERRGGNGIVGLAWTPDGTKLLSATRDGMLRTWDTTPTDPRFRGRPVAPPPREAKR